MDLLLYNTVINTVWYIFTLVFILYKFTTFFNYSYNFFKFCGKLISGGKYVFDLGYNYIRQKSIQKETTVIIDSDYHKTNNNENNKGLFYKIKENSWNLYYNLYHKFTGKYHPSSQENYIELPLYSSSTNLNNEVINSYSNRQNYNSLINESKRSFNSNFNSVNYENENSQMLYTIPLDNSQYLHNSNENTKPKYKPFGIDNSVLLFDSSFIKNKLDKKNLPFAMNSFFSTQLHSLQENYEGTESEKLDNQKELDESEGEDIQVFTSKYEECE